MTTTEKKAIVAAFAQLDSRLYALSFTLVEAEGLIVDYNAVKRAVDAVTVEDVSAEG